MNNKIVRELVTITIFIVLVIATYMIADFLLHSDWDQKLAEARSNHFLVYQETVEIPQKRMVEIDDQITMLELVFLAINISVYFGLRRRVTVKLKSSTRIVIALAFGFAGVSYFWFHANRYTEATSGSFNLMDLFRSEFLALLILQTIFILINYFIMIDSTDHFNTGEPFQISPMKYRRRSTKYTGLMIVFWTVGIGLVVFLLFSQQALTLSWLSIGILPLFLLGWLCNLSDLKTGSDTEDRKAKALSLFGIGVNVVFLAVVLIGSWPLWSEPVSDKFHGSNSFLYVSLSALFSFLTLVYFLVENGRGLFSNNR